MLTSVPLAKRLLEREPVLCYLGSTGRVPQKSRLHVGLLQGVVWNLSTKSSYQRWYSYGISSFGHIFIADCSDRHISCSAWARGGECTKNSDWMTEVFIFQPVFTKHLSSELPSQLQQVLDDPRPSLRFRKFGVIKRIQKYKIALKMLSRPGRNRSVKTHQAATTNSRAVLCGPVRLEV